MDPETTHFGSPAGFQAKYTLMLPKKHGIQIPPQIVKPAALNDFLRAIHRRLPL